MCSVGRRFCGFIARSFMHINTTVTEEFVFITCGAVTIVNECEEVIRVDICNSKYYLVGKYHV